MAKDLHDMRQEYGAYSLERQDLSDQPLPFFRQWLEQAEAAGLLEPNAMTVATVDADGQPYTRTVLLKELDERGLVFYTNLGSRKADQLAHNPRVSLLFTWLPLQRQVSINGTAEVLSRGEVMKYFIKRPLGSRLGAWASPQSKVISSRSLLEGKLAELKAKFAQGEVPLPDFWGGYRVVPQSFEFWQGGAHRLHDRFLYQREDGGNWAISRLAP
ncbi:MAG: pyridoxamine 5'-phosphate oxidase [Verrucomicrobiota bacterium JB022]|nr:pyridoxamine 5'-phosphate oxidase [Verrucomicrobiota bacterium JB022]